MRRKRPWIAPVLAAAMLSGAIGVWDETRAQIAGDQPGDATAGRRLADAWCTECHAIGVKTVDAPRRGPDFAEVAKRPATTALSLNVFLRSSHKTMPNLMMERREADDLVAYILSLKR